LDKQNIKFIKKIDIYVKNIFDQVDKF